MQVPNSIWTIRFAATVRQMFSRIPRGEAALFDEAVQLLRYGPTHIPTVERMDENVYLYSANRYQIVFEIVQDAENTVRVVAFQREPDSQ